ncbi:ATP-binding response regulator [Mastigocoleus testarum]|uniref:Circadian input-output histidine kinase CikA n=1 Tax=Mastigocoleus testarum BC008 TaxID=371196 RepID=A0A0V7ZNA7_9CYAN|nr:hybrid sensor histidine kinase/response regulator [Mastigocoleus testarum]KST65937.1 histidine kinase [Mastigocoleus testarum BC008]
MKKELSILVIDDDEVDRISVCRALNKIEFAVKISEASNYNEAVKYLERNKFDCIFLDYALPGKDGLAVVRELRDSGNKIPLVILTGQGDEQIAVEIMKAGASDYIGKSRISPQLLGKTLQHVVRIHEAERQIELFHQQLFESNEQLKRKNQELEEKQQQIHQQNLKLLEAAELKSRFLATMSHELRTPLNAIMVFSQMVLRKTKGKLSDSEADMVERILNNGKNLLELINDILDLSKIEAGGLRLAPEEFDIAGLIQISVDELRILAERKSLTINTCINLQNPVVFNDRTRVRQVIVNLLSNAIKFTDTGYVDVTVNEISEQWLIVSVCDTGIGIESEKLKHIFEPFRQGNQTNSRRYQGTGLGLAITDSLMKMMKGTIGVESELGKGSKFSLKLPRCLSQ